MKMMRAGTIATNVRTHTHVTAISAAVNFDSATQLSAVTSDTWRSRDADTCD